MMPGKYVAHHPKPPRVVGGSVTNQFGEWPLHQPIQRTTNYPTDDGLVTLMELHRSFKAVAAACGVRRESLRDYLSRRPGLDRRMRAFMRQKLTPEQKRENDQRSGRDYMRRQRLADPPTTRARRRLSMAGRKPPGDKPALDPATNDYARVLRADPCSYCGAAAEHIDHIEPVGSGGGLRWDNLTSACTSCNCRKRTSPLLVFLALRG